MNQQLVAAREDFAMQSVEPDTTPGGLLRYAMQRGADMETITKLMDLRDRNDAHEARKAYVAAMAQFKAEPLTIRKDKHVAFQTSKGTTEYDHATIGNVTSTIVAALARHGFSHRWDTNQGSTGITVTCIITHALGHSESTAMTAAKDESGGKNAIQSIASAVTYLQRYTLLAATGMATSDTPDDDGRGSEPEPEPEVDPILDPILEKIGLCETLDQLRGMKAEIAGANLPQEKNRRAIGHWNARKRGLTA